MSRGNPNCELPPIVEVMKALRDELRDGPRSKELILTIASLTTLAEDLDGAILNAKRAAFSAAAVEERRAAAVKHLGRLPLLRRRHNRANAHAAFYGGLRLGYCPRMANN